MISFRSPRHRRLGRIALGGCLATLLLAVVGPTRADVTLDGTIGSGGAGPVDSSIDGGGNVTYQIDEMDGEAVGSRNLFFSFDRFDLLSNETALFQSSTAFTNVISRITGGRSSVDGQIRSEIPGANFFFLNPEGMLFGPNASVDLTGSFLVSSADTLLLDDGGRFEASPLVANILTPGDPASFGFLGNPIGAFEVQGALQTSEGESLGIFGGDILIDGGALSALDGDVFLVSVASSGSVLIDPTGSSLPTPVGFSEFGDIRIVNEAIVSSSGLSPLIGRFNDPDNAESQLLSNAGITGLPTGSPFPPPGITLPEDAVAYERFPDGTRYSYSFVDRTHPVFARGAGRVIAFANDLLIEDSDIRADTVGSDAGLIDLRLEGDLTIRKVSSTADVGILARTGRSVTRVLARPPSSGSCMNAAPGVGCGPGDVVSGFQTYDFGPLTFALDFSDGDGGNIEIAARDVSLEDGGRISTTSMSRGSPGSITINATRAVTIEGVDPNAPGAEFASSAIFSNHQGAPDTPGAPGGSIDITADSLLLRDGGGVFAQTTGDGNAGDVLVDVARLEIRDDSQIDSSTSGSSFQASSGAPRPLGEGGSITVLASESVLLSGRTGPNDFARISTFSGENSDGGAGTIRVEAPSVVVERGAGIAVTTLGEGTGGDIQIDSDHFLMQQDAILSAASESTLSPAGTISVSTLGSTKILSGSAVTANTGISTGGGIVIDSQDLVVLGGDTVISANATIPGGSGGSVVIGASLVLQSSSSLVSASAPGGPEFQGSVVIESPVVALEDQLRPPPADFLDVSSMLLSECASRRSGERAGSFRVSRFPGLPASYDGPLMALETITGGRAKSLATGEIVSSLARGDEAVRSGRLVDADAHFSAALGRADGPSGLERSDALRGLGQARQLRGDFLESLAPLEEALALARMANDPAREAAALGQLGNVHRALGDHERARDQLEESVAAARRAAEPGGLAAALNHLGSFESMEGDWPAASEHYLEAARGAESADRPLLASQILANAARIELERESPTAAIELLNRSIRGSQPLGGGIEPIALRLHLADSYSRVAELAPALRRAGLSASHRLLIEANAEAGSISDERLRSNAFGRLGAVYAQEGGRTKEALYLTRRALASAERARAPELLARWSHQAGQISSETGEMERALGHHRRAVEILEQINAETRAQYGAGKARFKRAFAPIYMALVDTLLTSATGGEEANQAVFAEARETIERWKAAELRDYFQDECVARLEAEERPLDEIAPHAAIIYPILLADRLELLVSTRRGLSRYSVPVSRTEITEEIKTFRRLIGTRTTYQFRVPAKRLHEWLIAPYRERLREAGIDTLVFVPDGPLRTIPMGALYDGEQYLVETFSVVITPSLRLIAPRQLKPRDTRLLLAGVSESVQGFAPLEYVRSEIESVQALYGGKVLLDSDFRSDRLEEELRERPPGILHIASHAEFTGDPKTSYVLAHDRKLSMEDLSRLIASNRFGKEPLELLLLSACETAAGDDRSALGLAGLAIRSGARSAVGTLWPVSDEAASRLIVSFYESLGRPDVSRATALALGQRDLIQDRRFDHPYYWAGFMVINNWL